MTQQTPITVEEMYKHLGKLIEEGKGEYRLTDSQEYPRDLIGFQCLEQAHQKEVELYFDHITYQVH